MRLKLGPYQLGQAVEVQCLVVGGRPSPAVTWWRDHQIVDDSFAQLSEFKVENVLRLPSLRRSDLDSILTCQAGNSNSSQPVSTSVKLDLTCEWLHAVYCVLYCSVVQSGPRACGWWGCGTG